MWTLLRLIYPELKNILKQKLFLFITGAKQMCNYLFDLAIELIYLYNLINPVL